MNISNNSLEPFERALESLRAAIDPAPANDRERDGAIQRFEYTFELAWKTAKRYLDDLGIVSLSPKSVIRDMAQQGWIDDAETWLGYLRARNETTHIYKEEVARRVYGHAVRFCDDARDLLKRLKAL